MIRVSAMRLDGERKSVVVCARNGFHAPVTQDAALSYGLVAPGERADLEARGWEHVGDVPVLERKLRAFGRPLVMPKRERSGVRDISDLPADVRLTRLWDRFSVDIGYALERSTKQFEKRLDGERTLIFEDGDRYAIRAVCMFVVRDGVGYVLELMHDRSVTGMRAAHHLLGLALKAMSDAGARAARALSFTHSGSYAIYALHAFFKTDSLELFVKAGPDLPDSLVQPERWYVSYVDALIAT